MTVRMLGALTHLIGLSTDVKPIDDVTPGSTFLEEDTGARFFWNGINWRPSRGPDVLQGSNVFARTLDIKTHELLETVLKELQIANLHLQSISNENIGGT